MSIDINGDGRIFLFFLENPALGQTQRLHWVAKILEPPVPQEFDGNQALIEVNALFLVLLHRFPSCRRYKVVFEVLVLRYSTTNYLENPKTPYPSWAKWFSLSDKPTGFSAPVSRIEVDDLPATCRLNNDCSSVRCSP